MTIKRLLEQKKKMKAKMPSFIRQQTNRFKKLEKKWRWPTGQHSKMRLIRKGNTPLVHVGYRTPALVRGMLLNGLTPMRVFNEKDIQTLDAKKHTIVIGAAVGKRKKIMIIDAAHKKGISIYNIKDSKAYEKKVKDELAARKKGRKQKVVVEEKKEDKKSAKKEEKTKDTKAESDADDKEKKRLEAEKVMIGKTE